MPEQSKKKIRRNNSVRFKICCVLVLLIAAGTNYCIYVITANAKGSEANQWLLKFVFSFAQDLLVIPCFKLLFQVKLIKFLGRENQRITCFAKLGKKLVDPLVVKAIARRNRRVSLHSNR